MKAISLATGKRELQIINSASLVFCMGIDECESQNCSKHAGIANKLVTVFAGGLLLPG
jgi:hypothetical protein